MAATILQKIEGYLTGEGFPQLDLQLEILDCVDTKYENWENLAGTRGSSVAFQLPSRYITTNAFGMNPTGAPLLSQNYSERRTAMTVATQVHTDHVLSAVELATFDLEKGSMAVNAAEMVSTVATDVNRAVTNGLSLSTNRFLGPAGVLTTDNASIPKLTNTSYTEMVENCQLFRNYGVGSLVHCIIPTIVMTHLSASGMQQFTPTRNDKIQNRGWQIPVLNGPSRIKFYQSDFLSTPFEPGTFVNDQVAPTNIVAIDNTQTFQLPGTETFEDITILTLDAPVAGLTINAGAMLDIVPQTVGGEAIKLLQYKGLGSSYFNAQARVVENSSSAGGNLVIKIAPRLEATIPPTPATTVSRPITVVGGGEDRVRFVKRHLAGFMLVDKYAKFAAPRLASTFPFPSSTQSQGGVSMQVSQGHDPSTKVNFLAMDMLYGFLGVGEGAARIPFSPALVEA